MPKKTKTKKAKAKKTEAPQTGPSQPTAPPPVEIEFKDPDFSKVTDAHSGLPVQVVVVEGKALNASTNDGLVFVKSGQSTDFLLANDAAQKFYQDADGNVFYNVHPGTHGAPDKKAVDIVAAAK
jgi:hypothetical protein